MEKYRLENDGSVEISKKFCDFIVQNREIFLYIMMRCQKLFKKGSIIKETEWLIDAEREGLGQKHTDEL